MTAPAACNGSSPSPEGLPDRLGGDEVGRRHAPAADLVSWHDPGGEWLEPAGAPKVRRRPVPSSGLQLPVIGFGTGDNAGLMVRGTAHEQRLAVARSLELGIDYFDTAPDYGEGRAEENLGRALREVGEPATVCTKVEILPSDLDDVAGAVVRSVDGSLERLGVERVEIVQVHNAPALERALHTPRWGALEIGDLLDPGGALEGLERARSEGKVGSIGFTCAHAEPSIVRELLDTEAFDIVNVWFNLLNPSAGWEVPAELEVERDYARIIDHAAARGVAVAVFRPLAGGALTAQATGDQARHPLAGGQIDRDPEPFRRDLLRARGLAELLGCDGDELAELAYRFAMAHPGVTTVLGGFSDLGQLEAVGGLADVPDLTDQEWASVREAWGTNFGMTAEVR